MPPAKRSVEETIVEMELILRTLMEQVEHLKESNEGTLRTRGMKERLTLAENDIKLNKEAYEKLEKRISEFEQAMMRNLREAFTEVQNNVKGKLDEVTKKIDGVVTEANSQKTTLGKIQPWINVISWVVATIGGIILMQILTGHWRIVVPP